MPSRLARPSAADFFSEEQAPEEAAPANALPAEEAPPPDRAGAAPVAAAAEVTPPSLDPAHTEESERAMAPPPPVAMPPPPPPPPMGGFMRGEDLRSVGSAACPAAAADTATRALPRDWRAVPSKSRPGSISFVHVPTGLKQARFPESDPSPAQIAEHAAAVAAARAKKKRGVAPLLRDAPAANWRTYCKKRKS